jgi:alpha-L-fucosidase
MSFRCCDAVHSRRRFLAAVAGGVLAPAQKTGAVPSPRQLLWHDLEVYAFLHFSINTFTGKEWGYGDEDPALFHPTAFDADAIIEGLKAGGMRAVILTCKHHDGFCLWPTRTTAHSVRSSQWRDGKGDVVKDISEAARRQGLKFGVYLSPWDRNHPAYGSPEYVEIYRRQLRELLTEYGPIFEVWHDGANGGDGYYGGAREKRIIAKLTYYRWPETWDLVRSLQPDAVIFSDVGPDIRWVGNERGYAGETCWATYDPVGPKGDAPAPGYVREKDGETGTRHGSRWMPPECDVSIRPGWFWRAGEDARVKTPQQLLNLYYRSVGRGGSLLLNVPPDRRGLLADPDVASVRQFGRLLRDTFAEDLAPHTVPRLVSADRKAHWTTGGTTPEVVLALGREGIFNVIRIREAIQLGQRVEALELDFRRRDGGWETFARATSIGPCRLIQTPQDITATHIRLRITQASAPPALHGFGLFRQAT